MENERFPESEESAPGQENLVPESPDSMEESPDIQELTFSPEMEDVPPEDIPAETAPETQPEEIPVEEIPMDDAPGEIPDPAAQEPPDREAPPRPGTPPLTGAAFMASIPDVGEDYPEEPTDFEEVPENYADGLDGFAGPGGESGQVPGFAPPDGFGDAAPVPAPAEKTPEPEEDALQEYRDSTRDLSPEGGEPAPSEAPARVRPQRKGRPKRKKGEGLFGIPNILSTLVWLALIVAIGVTAGRMVWLCAADVLAFGREDRAVTITIYESDTMEDIQSKLYDAGLIRYKGLFDFYASISHAEEKIKPGIYDLNTKYDYHALVNFMTPRSNREVVKVTIPEGYTCRQIFALLEENKVCTARDIASYAATGELDEYWFLTYVERGQPYCLEGFLFPDTYEFYKNSTPKEALQRMLNNFGNRFDEEMQSQIDTLNDYLAGLMRTAGQSEEYISQHRFNTRDITIVASLIEKESAGAEESPTIASVIYNRLFNWGGNPAYLNIDASIVYALDGKTDLTSEDLQVDSPYNTYTHTGLTPTPISNPGLSSLKAALSPASTNYYYYVLNPETGVHKFSTTQEEHNAAITAYYG